MNPRWFGTAIRLMSAAADSRRIEMAAVSQNQKKSAEAVGKILKGLGYTSKRGGQAGYEKIYEGDIAAQQGLRRALKDAGFSFDVNQATGESTALWFDHPTMGRIESTVRTDNKCIVRHILPLR